MKKIFLLIITFFYFIVISSCIKVENEINLIPKPTINVSNAILDKGIDYNINYPATHIKEIDDYIYKEIYYLVKRIEENYNIKTLNISYSTYTKTDYISFVFNISLKTIENDEKNFYRSYNFNYKLKELIYLDMEKIESLFHDLINEKLYEQKLFYSYYECLALDYIINDSTLRFIIPELSTGNDYYFLDFKTLGYLSQTIENITEEDHKKKVVLTFDDGPSHKTKDLVNILLKYNIKATFFILGNQIKNYPSYLTLLYNKNFEIGNHSFSHRDFTKLSKVDILHEINYTQELIYKHLGIYPKIFRFPYGSYTNEMLKYIDMPIILWNVDSLDWKLQNKDIIKERVLNQLLDNSIILFHDNALLDVNLIEEIIVMLKLKGFEFVSIFEYFSFKFEENQVSGKIYR